MYFCQCAEGAECILSLAVRFYRGSFGPEHAYRIPSTQKLLTGSPARRVVKKRTSTPSTSDRQNNGFVYYAMPRCLGPSTHPDTNARCTAMTNTACKPRDSARSAPLSVCLSVCPSTYILSYIYLLLLLSIYLLLLSGLQHVQGYSSTHASPAAARVNI